MKKILLFIVAIFCMESGFAQTRILPVGESTTESSPGWRKKFCELLTADGVKYDMVGPKNDGSTTHDGDHAGYSGFTAWSVQEKVESFYGSHPADMILIWEGTNDCGWASEDGSTAALSNLIDKCCQLYPNAKVLVASIPPMSYDAYTWHKNNGVNILPGVAQANAVAYNKALPSLCATKAAQGKKVTFVDASSLTVAEHISNDGIHPNQAGYDKMGGIFYNAVKSALVVSTTNLGFENGFTSWVTYANGNLKPSINTDNVRPNSSSTVSGYFANGGGNYEVTGLTPGATYKVRAWVKAVSGTENWITVSGYNGQAKNGEKMTSTSWTQSGDIVFTVGANSNKVTLAAWAGNGSAAYFDDYTIDLSDVWTKIDNAATNKGIVFDANWGSWSGPHGYYKGTMHGTKDQSTVAEVTFSFTGTKVRYYGGTRWDFGIADIYLDDVLVTSVDMYGAEANDKVMYESGNLAYGAHTLKVKATNRKNSASTGLSIFVDAFEYSTSACANCRSSAEVTSKTQAEALTLKVHPNPATREVTIDLSGFAGESAVQVKMSDMSGKPFLGRQVQLGAGVSQVTLPVGHLPKGLFFVTVQGSRAARTAKLVVTK